MDRVERLALEEVAAELQERPLEVRQNVIMMHRQLSTDRSLARAERAEEAERADILCRLLGMPGAAKGGRGCQKRR
jgi:hypothetical protein